MKGKYSKQRGPERLRPDDGSRILTIKFRTKEYAKLKCLSVDFDTPIRNLVMDAIREVYGETSQEEIDRVYGRKVEDLQPRKVDTVNVAPVSWSFTADTHSQPMPAKPSTIPKKEKAAPATDADAMLKKMLQG
jgi:hypothetical protein